MEDMAVMSAGFRQEERSHHDKMVHTKVVVRARECALTINHWSSINAASLEMVEKLELLRTPHPQPYVRVRSAVHGYRSSQDLEG